MKVNLFDVNEYIKINKLKEVSSPILFDRNSGPHPDGLISNEIFGYNTKSRKETFAYIDLKKPFLHPHVYKSMRRFFRAIDDIVKGTKRFKLVDGVITEDEKGETGIGWLYKTWDKIKWPETDSSVRKERIALIENYPKNTIWIDKMIVIPAFYRDVLDTSSGAETGELNGMYVKLIRAADMLDNSVMFDFAFYNTDYNIQQTLVDIYDYFKLKLQKKNGLIRKALLGKTVDYSVRTVITAPMYQADRLEDMSVNFTHTQMPLTQVLVAAYPFIIKELKSYFERNVFSKKDAGIPKYDYKTKTIIGVFYPVDPESYFTDQYFDKVLNNYVKNTGSRFDKIMIPGRKEDSEEIIKMPLSYSGYMGYKNSDSGIFNREMCWTDLLYIIACDVVNGKHVMVTRYPDLGTFFNKINVIATNNYHPVTIDGKVYPFYPIIDYTASHDDLSGMFVDSLSFSNSYCKNMIADYDGDQITVKIIWSEEGNEEAEKFINSKQNLIDATGNKTHRVIESEAIQTFYVMTKDPKNNSKTVPPIVVNDIINTPLEKMDYNFFCKLLGDTFSNGQVIPARYNCYDKVNLSKKDYKFVNSDIETTLGRLLYNRFLIERCDLYEVIGFINKPITSKVQNSIQTQLTNALIEDKIVSEQFIQFIEARDYLGLKLNALLTTSYSLIMMKTPEKVVKRKAELLEKYRDDVARGDVNRINAIENELLDMASKEIDDDPAMDLFKSGARGSFENNYKNNNIMRGAIPNNITGGYDVVTSCYQDGFRKEDVPAMSSVLLAGAYTKAVSTSDSGYLQKEVVQLMQTEYMAEEGSDCKSKHPIPITVSKDDVYRYIVENGKLVRLTKENIDKYIGKTVLMRTPMSCINKNGCCNICAGDKSYKMGVKNVGLLASSIGQTLTNLNMKSFHDSTIKIGSLDMDSSVVDI